MDPIFKTCDGADDPPSTKPSKSANTFLQPTNVKVECKPRNLKQDDGIQPLDSKIIGTKPRKPLKC